MSKQDKSFGYLIARLRSKLGRLLPPRLLARVPGFGVAATTIQLHGNTWPDRYPFIFATLAELALQHRSPDEPLRILSFGCSTGEEAFTLASRYFAEVEHLRVIGLDINPDAIAVARANNRFADRVAFYQSKDSELATHGPYDIVCAMSVLCVWPESAVGDDISRYMTFTSFDGHLRNLDAHLKVGGHFVIYNASFCFADSSIASRYEPILLDAQQESGFVRKFGTDNRALGDDYVYPYFMFRKLA